MIALRAFVIFLLLFAMNGVVFADKHSQREVKALINEVETKLDLIRAEGAQNYAERAVSQIDRYIRNAKKLLDDGDEDLAFYEISKGRAYFKLIEAKKELMIARIKLQNARSNR
jgi:hypothetical protein